MDSAYILREKYRAQVEIILESLGWQFDCTTFEWSKGDHQGLTLDAAIDVVIRETIAETHESFNRGFK